MNTATITNEAAQVSTNSVATVTEAKLGLEKFIPQQYLETLGFLNTFQIFGNTILQYIFALVVVLISYILLPIVWGKFAKYLSLATEQTLPDLSALLKEQLNKINSKIFLLIAIYLGVLTLTLPSVITDTLKGIVLALVAVQIAVIVAPLVEPILRTIPVLNKPEMKPITTRIIALAKTALWAVVGIFSLGSLGISTAPLLGGLGVLGLGGALAFQNMMPGFIKVLSFHFSKSFSIGDKISAGTIQGVVEEIDITTTKIKKVSGEVVDVKNEELLTATVIPADGPHFISETVKINLDMKNELNTFTEIENIFKSCLANIPDTKFEKVLFTDFKGAGVNADLNYSVLIEKKIENRHLILGKLITELKSKNITFTA